LVDVISSVRWHCQKHIHVFCCPGLVSEAQL
jgi:hypothetical protein